MTSSLGRSVFPWDSGCQYFDYRTRWRKLVSQQNLVRVAASDRRQTIQVTSTNYTCHRLSSVSLGFSIGLRGPAPAADETTPLHLHCSKVPRPGIDRRRWRNTRRTLAFDARFHALVRPSVFSCTTTFLSSGRDTSPLVSPAEDQKADNWIPQCARARDDALAIARCSIYSRVDSTVRRGRFTFFD